MYSKCSAPSTISASGIIVPSGSFTISWSGARGGTNNTITGYDVYYKISSNGAAPTISSYDGKVSVGSTISSYTFTMSSATRGHKTICGIVTKGSAGVNYYSSIKTGGLVSINNLPSSPDIISGDGIEIEGGRRVSSSTNQINITCFAGTDTDSQNYSVWYSTSATGQKTQISNQSFTYNFPSGFTSGILYFWTKDDLEYSNGYTTLKIEKNIAPTLSVSGTRTTYKANNLTDWTSAVNVTFTTNKTSGTISGICNIKINQETSETNISLPDININNTNSTNNYQLFNIFEQSSFTYDQSKIYNFTFTFTYNDGLETAQKTLPTDTTKYSIAPFSTSKTFYNQYANSNISGTTIGEFYNKARLRLYKDESMTNETFSTSKGVIRIANITNDTTYRYYDLEFTVIPTAGETTTITYTGYAGENSKIKKSYNFDMTETKVPNMTSTFTHGFGTVNMFNVGTTLANCTMGWPFTGSTSYTEAASQYNLSTTLTNAIKLKINNGANYKIWNPTFNNTPTPSSGIVSTTSYTNLYDWNHSLGIDRYIGTKTLQLQYEITNLFGQKFLSKTADIKFNFDATPTLTNSTFAAEYATSSSGSYTSLGNKYLQYEAFLQFKIQANLFTENDFTINLYEKPHDGVSAYTLKNTQTYRYSTSLNYGTNFNAAGINKLTIPYGQIPMLQHSSYDFQIELIQNGKVTTIKTFPAIQFSNVTTVLNSCQYNPPNSNTWIYNATLNDGTGNQGICTVNEYLYDSTSGKAVSASLSGSSGIITSTKPTGWTNTTIQIHTVREVPASTSSNVTLLSKKTYHDYSNIILVYNETPTVLYRKHQIGVNIADNDMDTNNPYTIIIKSGQNRDGTVQEGIMIGGPYGNAKVKIVNDNTKLTTAIYLADFIIDGGEL